MRSLERKCRLHGEMAISMVDRKRAEPRLVLVHGDVGNKTVVSDINRFGKASL